MELVNILPESKKSTLRAEGEFFRKFRAGPLLAAAFTFLAIQGFASPPEEEFPTADPRVLELRIELRDPVILTGERLQYEVILRNAGSEPIPMAVPSGRHDLDWIAGNQLFLEPIWDEEPNIELLVSRSQEYYARPLPARIEEAPWPPVDVYDNRPPERIEWLPAGYEIAIPGNRINESIFIINNRSRLRGLRASWLTGPGRWVESEVAPLTVRDWDRNADAELVYEMDWTKFGLRRRPTTITQVEIDGRLILFAYGHVRLGEISPGERFEVEFSQEVRQMVVSFPESNRGPYYFHRTQAVARDKPYGIGGYSYFTPEARPIPPEELRALRERLGLSEAGDRIGLLTSLGNRARAWFSWDTSDSNRGSAGLPWWLWTAGGVFLAAAFLAAAGIILRCETKSPGRLSFSHYEHSQSPCAAVDSRWRRHKPWFRSLTRSMV